MYNGHLAQQESAAVVGRTACLRGGLSIPGVQLSRKLAVVDSKRGHYTRSAGHTKTLERR